MSALGAIPVAASVGVLVKVGAVRSGYALTVVVSPVTL